MKVSYKNTRYRGTTITISRVVICSYFQSISCFFNFEKVLFTGVPFFLISMDFRMFWRNLKKFESNSFMSCENCFVDDENQPRHTYLSSILTPV